MKMATFDEFSDWGRTNSLPYDRVAQQYARWCDGEINCSQKYESPRFINISEIIEKLKELIENDNDM